MLLSISSILSSVEGLVHSFKTRNAYGPEEVFGETIDGLPGYQSFTDPAGHSEKAADDVVVWAEPFTEISEFELGNESFQSSEQGYNVYYASGFAETWLQVN